MFLCEKRGVQQRIPCSLLYLFLYFIHRSFSLILHESFGCINSRTYVCGSHTSVLNFIFSTLSSSFQTIYLLPLFLPAVPYFIVLWNPFKGW